MRTWPVQDAKAKFSEMLDASVREGPQVITRRGVQTAVLVPIEQWERLKGTEGQKLDLKDWLLAPEPRFELKLPRRGRYRWRPPIEFE